MNIIRAGVLYRIGRIVLILFVVIVSLSSLCKHKPDENYLEPINISNNSGRSENPSIAVDSRNTVHLVWNDDTPGNEEIYYTYKPASGNWSTPINISNTTRASRFPCIKVDRNDNLHLVWQDATPDGYWRLFYSQKPYGDEWSIPETIWTGLWDVRPRIDIDSFGKVYMVWYAGGYSGWIFFSTRQGYKSWTPPLLLSQTERSYVYAPVITVTSKGEIFVAWSRDGDIIADIFYVMCDTSGQWTTSPINLSSSSPTELAHYPVITSDLEGNVHIAWIQNALIYRFKPYGGNWREPEYVIASRIPSDIRVDNNNTIYIACVSSILVKKSQSGIWQNPLLIYPQAGGPSVIGIDGVGTKHIAFDCYKYEEGQPENREIYYINIKNY